MWLLDRVHSAKLLVFSFSPPRINYTARRTWISDEYYYTVAVHLLLSIRFDVNDFVLETKKNFFSNTNRINGLPLRTTECVILSSFFRFGSIFFSRAQLSSRSTRVHNIEFTTAPSRFSQRRTSEIHRDDCWWFEMIFTRFIVKIGWLFYPRIIIII